MKKVTLLLASMLWLNLGDPSPPKDLKQEFQSIRKQDENFYEPLTPKNVYWYLLRNDIRYAEIVFRQIIQETGHFTSTLCTDSNNLFGMTHKVGYTYYSTWKKSVMAYKRWQERHIQQGRDLTDYYSFLNKIRYAEDPFYIYKLKAINVNQYLDLK
mgnify:CR=1 FL=1